MKATKKKPKTLKAAGLGLVLVLLAQFFPEGTLPSSAEFAELLEAVQGEGGLLEHPAALLVLVALGAAGLLVARTMRAAERRMAELEAELEHEISRLDFDQEEAHLEHGIRSRSLEARLELVEDELAVLVDLFELAHADDLDPKKRAALAAFDQRRSALELAKESSQ